MSFEKERSLAELISFSCGPLGEIKKSYGINKFSILQMDGLVGKQIKKIILSLNKSIDNYILQQINWRPNKKVDTWIEC